MVGTPADTPVTTPVDEPTVAIAVLLLLQVPPVVASLIIIEEPVHTVVRPVIGEGVGLTVIA